MVSAAAIFIAALYRLVQKAQVAHFDIWEAVNQPAALR